MPSINQSQIASVIRWLLTTGGPGAAYLVSQGMAPSQINNIMTVALAVVPPLISFIWGQISSSTSGVMKAAEKIGGVHLVVDSASAPAAAVAAATDPTRPNVVLGAGGAPT